MTIQIDSVTLSVRSDGCWIGQAETIVDGVKWSGQLLIRAQAQADILNAVAELRDFERENRYRATRRETRRTRHEMGLCMSCPKKTKAWRCDECARLFRERRAARRMERKSA